MGSFTMDQLRERVRGAVITSEDGGYDEARRVYNAMIDRRPRVVVRCANAGDAMAAVDFARENELDLAVRGGSHSVPGFGVCDDGVVADLSGMRGVRVNPADRTARAEGGATWGDFNAATYPFGLATTGGIISTTGVAGLTLGGGIGYLDRGLGLSCDNLISADVVTADGRLLIASEEENPDLFWALRGGGGNFGAVTSLQFRLGPVKDIYGGPIFFELDHAGDILRFYRDFISDAPEQLGMFPAFQIAPPLPFIPEDRHGEPFIALVTCWAGPLEEGEQVLRPIREVAPIVAEAVGPMPYPALNSAFDALVPPGLQHYWKANFNTDLTDAAIEAHLVHGPKVPVVNSTVHIYPINGACHRVAADATAFAYRDATFATVIAGMWPDPAQNEANTQWVRDYYQATAPHSEEGGYINFMAADDQDRIAANYKGNYSRLVDIKRTYDPATCSTSTRTSNRRLSHGNGTTPDRHPLTRYGRSTAGSPAAQGRRTPRRPRRRGLSGAEICGGVSRNYLTDRRRRSTVGQVLAVRRGVGGRSKRLGGSATVLGLGEDGEVIGGRWATPSMSG